MRRIRGHSTKSPLFMIRPSSGESSSGWLLIVRIIRIDLIRFLGPPPLSQEAVVEDDTNDDEQEQSSDKAVRPPHEKSDGEHDQQNNATSEPLPLPYTFGFPFLLLISSLLWHSHSILLTFIHNNLNYPHPTPD